MKKINDIISSELVIRTNNNNLRQEYGEVGLSSNIGLEGSFTVFTTKVAIKKVNYVTVNGINLIEGVHYDVVGTNKIKVSSSGAPIKKNPSITTTLLVSYYADIARASTIKVAPTLNLFSINKTSGRDGEIVFNFSISPFDGKNIYWSILKDGNAVPLHSGKTLYTNNGISNDGVVSVKLNHFITPVEYLARKGDEISFTFVAVYDLTEDGSRLNEKLMSSVTYHVESSEIITGSITAVPEMVTTANSSNEATISYQVNYPLPSTVLFDWAIFKSVSGGQEVILRQGNQASNLLAGTIDDSFSSSPGNNFEVRYFLKVKEVGTTDYIIISNDKITVIVPQVALIGNAGYLDASIMSYIDPLDSIRKKIGSLGTPQDKVEYLARVPGAIFTKDITQEFLSNNEFISPSVNTFGGTVSSVYFVMEIPDNWGPFDIYQPLGLLNQSTFNKISLGNGYTAYLYNVAPSDASVPSDYYLKAK